MEFQNRSGEKEPNGHLGLMISVPSTGFDDQVNSDDEECCPDELDNADLKVGGW